MCQNHYLSIRKYRSKIRGSNSCTNMYPQSERRSSTRFPLQLLAVLCAGDVRISGKTANISGGGLLMTCDEDIRKGTPVTVRIQWPIGQGESQLSLVVRGIVVRREPDRVAILHRRHDFEVVSRATIER